jgi:hypothetical protein
MEPDTINQHLVYQLRYNLAQKYQQEFQPEFFTSCTYEELDGYISDSLDITKEIDDKDLGLVRKINLK